MENSQSCCDEMMKSWWQHLPQHIDPVLIHIGPIDLRYYGVMYCLCILVIYALLRYRIKYDRAAFSSEMMESYFLWAVIAAVLGARLGYVLFYDFSYFWHHPLSVISPFGLDDGMHFVGIQGLSYHGGLLGVILVTVIFCRKRRISILAWADFVIPTIPLGYTLGRLGNFLNGELYGRITDVAWGMYFPQDSSGQLRHPSQLYEAFFEGLVLFCALWPLRNVIRSRGTLVGMYLLGYAGFRFLIEFYREPDVQLGLVIFSLSMGQLLCGVMAFVGMILLRRGYVHGKRVVFDDDGS